MRPSWEPHDLQDGFQGSRDDIKTAQDGSRGSPDGVKTAHVALKAAQLGLQEALLESPKRPKPLIFLRFLKDFEVLACLGFQEGLLEPSWAVLGAS